MSQTSNRSDIATDLLTDLERRLQRAEFYVTGAHEPHEVPAKLEPPIFTRLQRLEKEIKELTSSHAAYRDLLELYSKHSLLFDVRNVLPIRVAQDDANAIPLTEQLNVVKACAPLFPSTVSRLNLLKDTPIPRPEASAALLALGSRLDRGEDVCDMLSEDLFVLRTRSLLLKQRIWKLANLSMLGCWAEFEQRLLDCERMVRRAEIAKAE